MRSRTSTRKPETTSTGPLAPPATPGVSLPRPLIPAVFLARPNRFLVEASLADGRTATAHLADPGRLKELLLPGVALRLHPNDGSRPRRTAWSVVLVRRPDGRGWVSVDTTVPNRLVAAALRTGSLDEFQEWSLVRAEVPVGSSRFDFLLRRVGPVDLYLEVKSASLVEDRTALFPDAVTSRGTRHLRELTELASRKGTEAAVLFVVQRSDADRVEAARHIDPGFADALAEARRAGVRILARRCRVGTGRVAMTTALPVL